MRKGFEVVSAVLTRTIIEMGKMFVGWHIKRSGPGIYDLKKSLAPHNNPQSVTKDLGRSVFDDYLEWDGPETKH